MTKVTRSSIIFAAGITTVVVCLLATSVRAADFDVREYISDGTLFELYDSGIELRWDKATQTLEVVSAHVKLDTETWLDNAGRLMFTTSPGAGSLSSKIKVEGKIDLMPNGDFYLEIDQYWDDGRIDALSARSNGTYTMTTGFCFCDDGNTFGCITNACNAGTKCPPEAGIGPMCVWTDPGPGT